ncbi:hypothetical protein FXW78_04790 [Rhodococcus opacus]|nr:hypothetical protein [Rhodococcus opacus]RZL78583.1 MAG: hypothetical protein EOP32_21545 [Rhodococcus sp. (in: high G+C Gram-positive bacteria)]
MNQVDSAGPPSIWKATTWSGSTLIDEIDRSGDPVAVDFAAVGFLADYCCAPLRVSVTSGTRSELRLSRMKLREELLEIEFTAR